MTDIDLLGPGAAGAARTLGPNAPTVTSVIEYPDADDTFFGDCVANVAGTGTPLVSEFLNRVLQQLRRVIRNSGVTLNNANDDMLWDAIQAAVPGRLLRVSTYTNVAGVQYVQVNGGAPTTAGATSFSSLPQTNNHLIEVVGGGGASGGAVATTAGYFSLGYAGNPGSYGLAYLPGAVSGIAITVAAPAAGASGAAGGSGPSSSFGSLITAPGGGGGGVSALTNSAAVAGAIGTVSGSCTVSGAASLLKNYWSGGPTFVGFVIPSASAIIQPVGGAAGIGLNAYAWNRSYGGGAGGTVNSGAASAQTGNAGSSGLIIVYECA